MTNEELMNYTFAPCISCKILVESFKKAAEKVACQETKSNNDYKEENEFLSHKTDRIKWVEIQKNLCSDIKQGRHQCRALAEEYKDELQKWFENQNSYPDLLEYLCIKAVKKCCPKYHYGSDCKPCVGYPDNVCNNNGLCKGAGTRLGNGKCSCDKGYTGEYCFECSAGYYQSYKDDKKLLCTPCHKACKGSCTRGAASDCQECNLGWLKIEGKGCIDIDECYEKDNSCPHNTFCINTEGNYTCLDCDKACDGCDGDGPDMCKKCSEEYEKKENVCINISAKGRKTSEDFYRYARYLGLSVATGIILQRNIYVAGVIGLCVAAYITVSEYTITQNDSQTTIPNLDSGKSPK